MIRDLAYTIGLELRNGINPTSKNGDICLILKKYYNKAKM